MAVFEAVEQHRRQHEAGVREPAVVLRLGRLFTSGPRGGLGFLELASASLRFRELGQDVNAVGLGKCGVGERFRVIGSGAGPITGP